MRTEKPWRPPTSEQTKSTMESDMPTVPDASMRHPNSCPHPSISSDRTMSHEQGTARSQKFAAYELFGEMRSSTQEERDLFEKMLARKSVPIDVADKIL